MRQRHEAASHNGAYVASRAAIGEKSLRKKFASKPYLGIALEINQKFPRGDERRWRALRAALVTSLRDALANMMD